jgi:nitroreductase
MDFQQVIRDRFSVRQYMDRAVEQEKIDAILEAGRIAPTAKNLQPIKIYVVNSPE